MGSVFNSQQPSHRVQFRCVLLDCREKICRRFAPPAHHQTKSGPAARV